MQLAFKNVICPWSHSSCWHSRLVQSSHRCSVTTASLCIRANFEYYKGAFSMIGCKYKHKPHKETWTGQAHTTS